MREIVLGFEFPSLLQANQSSIHISFGMTRIDFDGFVEVTSGVAEGDKVVVNGNFLIDAESNLQAALKGFSTPSTTEAPQ